MKRVTDEERVVLFFQDESPERVKTVFNIVRGIVKSRFPKAAGKPGRKRRAGAGLAEGEAGADE